MNKIKINKTKTDLRKVINEITKIRTNLIMILEGLKNE